ncbi:hypothetical protein G3I44_14255 [Halogeometricum borinquense]|uniref:Uncharacterized protein n=1 Tax=Halogeometricum borinquense TaxID=60847 RepID=A0A6C0UQX4_9EURY|nr:hypothetical protein [Halogeometricum borinquense]QIB75348.1 hypothetical protein G3I44_14255 [Halogeometricum borinquense]
MAIADRFIDRLINSEISRLWNVILLIAGLASGIFLIIAAMTISLVYLAPAGFAYVVAVSAFLDLERMTADSQQA